MWMVKPTTAGPAVKKNASPPSADCIEDSMAVPAALHPGDEAMWYMGVKNPVPWYVAPAIIANIAMNTAPTRPPTIPSSIQAPKERPARGVADMRASFRPCLALPAARPSGLTTVCCRTMLAVGVGGSTSYLRRRR
jgi:hypothetical protein